MGEAFVELSAKVSGNPTADAEKGLLGPIGGLAKKAATVFAAGFAAQKLFDFGKGAFAAAEESAKIGAQTAAAIKSTGGAAGVTANQVGALATKISGLTGVDDEAIQSASNLLLTFTNVRNGVGENNQVFDRATSTLVDMAAALGTDAAGSAVQLGKALNDPIGGISALSRVGVTFTDQQKEMIKTMVESGNVAGAQGIILDELGKEFGGSAAAQATATDKMKVALGNVQEAIGGLLIPAVSAVASALAEVLPRAVEVGGKALGALRAAFSGEGITSDGYIGAFERIGVAARRVVDYFVKNWPEIRRVATEVGDRVRAGVGAAFGFLAREVVPRLVAGFQGLVEGLRATIGWFTRNTDVAKAVGGALLTMVVAIKTISAVTKIYTAVQTALNSTLLANPVVLIVAGLVALGAAVYVAYQRSAKFRDIVDSIGRFLRDEVLPALIEFGQVMVGAFQSALGGVTAAFNAVVPVVQGAIAVVSAVISGLATAVSATIATIQSLWGTFGGSITTVIGGVFTVVSSIVSGAFLIIKGLFDAFVGLITGDWGQFWDGLGSVVQGVWTLIAGYVTGGIEIVKGVLGAPLAALGTTWNAVWGGMRDFVNGIWEGITTKVSGAWDGIKLAVAAGVDGVVGFVEALPGRITAAVSGAWDALKRGFKDALNVIIDLINGFKVPSLTIGGFDPLGAFGPSVPEVTIGGWSLPKIPRLAKGALVFGPTGAVVGDNPNARANPEVVAPLDRLTAIIANALGGRTRGGVTIQVDASTTIQAPVYGVNDLEAFFEDRDRRLAATLRSGLLRVV